MIRLLAANPRTSSAQTALDFAPKALLTSTLCWRTILNKSCGDPLKEQSAPPRERDQVDARENLRLPDQLDTFVDSRTERTIRLKFGRQLICGAVIRIED
jgi:hypothetical protein